MCSCCRMDPRDVKMLRQRQGAVEVEDFYKEVNYAVRNKKVGRPKKAKGCPENNHGPHIYVWTTEEPPSDWPWSGRNEEYFEANGIYRYEYKRCAGCGREAKRRYTKEFSKLVAKYGWYRAYYPKD